jgi:phage shock protein A
MVAQSNKVVALTIPTLEEHLDECEQRYQGVIERLDSMDKKMDRLETLMIDIKHSLTGPDFNYQ